MALLPLLFVLILAACGVKGNLISYVDTYSEKPRTPASDSAEPQKPAEEKAAKETTN